MDKSVGLRIYETWFYSAPGIAPGKPENLSDFLLHEMGVTNPTPKMTVWVKNSALSLAHNGCLIYHNCFKLLLHELYLVI